MRIVDGAIEGTPRLLAMNTGKTLDPLEIGVLVPVMLPINELTTGQVGYIATGLKTLQDLDVGDTITLAAQPATDKLPRLSPTQADGFRRALPEQPGRIQ